MADHQDDEHVQCDHSKRKKNITVSQELENSLMQKEEFSLDDWTQIYENLPYNRNTGEPSHALVTYINELLPSEPARVLVPLCGKSPDMRWLYDRGNTVVGVEGVERPVKEFFQSHTDLRHTVEDVPFGKVYKSHDERLQVFVCDITQVPRGSLGHFDAGFDWGAYTAIRPSDRQKYVDVVRDALGENFRYFLEVCHDGPPKAPGLPHSISLRTIKLEFGVSLKMRVLATKDVSAEWEVDTFFNSFFLLSDQDL
uniref:Thiopurine S-methyltransferase n=2 Tax=Scylla olivacea TaxID=85551 RepID=A0A0P4W3F7_SCYOL